MKKILLFLTMPSIAFGSDTLLNTSLQLPYNRSTNTLPSPTSPSPSPTTPVSTFTKNLRNKKEEILQNLQKEKTDFTLKQHQEKEKTQFTIIQKLQGLDKSFQEKQLKDYNSFINTLLTSLQAVQQLEIDALEEEHKLNIINLRASRTPSPDDNPQTKKAYASLFEQEQNKLNAIHKKNLESIKSIHKQEITAFLNQLTNKEIEQLIPQPKVKNLWTELEK